MRNFIPNRMVRATGVMQRMNIDDGDIYMGEFANGALCSIQTSYVTVGNYPGHRGADLRQRGRDHLPAGRRARHLRADLAGRPRTRSSSSGSRCRSEFYPPGGSPSESWRTLFYANLVSSFITEILADDDANEGNFDDGAWVQETINAVERSFRERRWVTLPLDVSGADAPATAALDRFFDAFYRRRPVSATFTGLHEHDERLPDWSADGLAGAADEMRALRRDLDAAGRVPDEPIVRFPGRRGPGAGRRASRDRARRARERALRAPQSVAVDRRGDLRRAAAW